jgi:dimethylargininase
MTARIALVRAVSDSIVDCELTHLERTSIDAARARDQHAEYCAALRAAGCEVVEVPALHDHPDAVFVEDCAVVVDGLAVITRPGAASRRGEVESVASVLARYRPLARIVEPATLDGGDVLRIGRTLFVGMTPRTNAEGIAQLRALLAPHGDAVVAVPVKGCLHLKTGVTEVAPGVVLINPEWIDPTPFAGLTRIEVDPDEPMAANALRLGDRVIYPDAFPRTAARLAARGVVLARVPADELGKAEGGVTCCSIVFEA